MMSLLTMEVSQVYAEGWKKKVEEVWQPACKAGIKRSVSHCDSENVVGKDKIMPGLKVTEETYDGCKQSFIAAVCHHGIPLLYVNVWTPGEQQFYILSLLAKLFEHLPDMWMIGCLYDIGCQIDQALHKWDFFPLEWNSCLVWGVSIFHVYGHQWACQLWYHPWKDECWGLADGEVCEQFWSGLCHLVPGLCIAGYHCRLFILDMQMEHIQKSKRSGLGEWLHSHLLNAKRCLEDAERGLGKHDVDQLLVHFKAQRRYHTKPLPQQSKNPGQCEIDHILSLKGTLEVQRSALEDLLRKETLHQGSDSAADMVCTDWQEQVDVLQASVKCLKGMIKNKCDMVGVSGDTLEELKWAENDEWMKGFLNLHILKDQLLCKLRS